MSTENRSRPNPTGGQGGLLIVGLVVLLIVGLVATFLVVVEQPRQARNAAVETIRTKFSGEVETVSNCPDWLVNTFLEDYFTYVVAVRVAHSEPLAPNDTRYLAALGDLDVLDVALPRGAKGIVESLPYSRDLVVLKLANATALPPADDVPNLVDLTLVNPAWGPGDARVLATYENVERVSLLIHDPAVVTEAIAAVSRLPRLKQLRLQWSRVPDEVLAHLVAAKSLQLLDLSTTGVSAEGVRHLAAVPSLQHLQLDNDFHGYRTGVVGGPAALSLAARVRARGEEQQLRNAIGDEAMSHVAKLKDLRFLQLDYTDVGDAGAAHLATLPILQYLYLAETPVGNAGVRDLAKLVHLKRLNLRQHWFARGLIDDETVDSLVTLTDLEILNLNFTDVSREGLARLRLELPRTEVDPHRPRHTPSPLKKAQLERENP